MTSVLIVDDHHLIRTGVKNLLEGAFPGMRVEGAPNIADALQFLGENSAVDLVLLDVYLPDATALDGLQRLKQSHPATAVALISGTEDHEIIRGALEQSADGFIPKSADPQVLVHAVSLILEGEIFLPRSYLRAAPPPSSPPPEKPRQNDLTARQKDVFALMREGLSNKEIARQLGLSESTIKSHISAILRELGTPSRAKAIALSQDGAR